MPSEPMLHARSLRRFLLAATTLLAPLVAGAQADSARRADPRVGLRPGLQDAGEAIRNLELVAHRPRPQGFFNPTSPGDFGFVNADLAFRGDLAFLGGFNGVQIWDITTPSSPTLRTALVCPGGQGDVSVHGNLLFMSVEETRGRVNCGTQPVTAEVSPERFRGVRIFDISNIAQPRQIAAVQTCRGSHTHTLVTSPRDSANVFIYVSGTAPARPAAELPGCSGPEITADSASSYFRIEIIRVPLAAPQDARVVNAPRIFADTAGNVAGLWRGGAHGPGTQTTAQTDMCHDITVYSEIGLAAGACSGNGILLDVSDPVNPKRIDEVTDPNFAYWHSATFNNDGTALVFTDEWGGGVAPRCRVTDRPEWGANALFTLKNRRLNPVGYFKIPAPQTAQENCVAHNGSLIPVPGRDLMVQAWYQGGISVFDFTDPANPVEIAYFDRGPLSATELMLGGYWSAYWYNGYIYGSEIARGLDVFRLRPSEFLTQNEIDAAASVRLPVWNPQNQQRITWPATFVVARAYVDGLMRGDPLRRPWGTSVLESLARAERASGAARRTELTQLATRLERDAVGRDSTRVRGLLGVVQGLAR